MILTPLTYAWQMARAEAAPLGLILRGRNVESGQIVTLPYGTDVVTWSVGLPSGLRSLTTAPGGGLLVDADGVLRFPLAPADLATAPAKAVLPVLLRITKDDGVGRTFLVGTLSLLD